MKCPSGSGLIAVTMASAERTAIELPVAGKTVRISSPERVYFSARGETKLDLARYYISVGDGIVRALRERPCMLHRFPRGVDGDKVHQKRLPQGAPPWVDTVRVDFPSGRHADELCVTDLAGVVWAVQMATVEFHPWNSRRADVERPDEWRIDLDPMPDCRIDRVRRVAGVAREVLDEIGAVGWPKTSGGSGLHIYVRTHPRWGFGDVRRAALAFAREVERRAPRDATTTWWRKDREPDKVFVDYNQNARDHTIASAYSVRGVKEGTVSTPVAWDEIDDAIPQDFTIATVPARFARLGDLHEGIDEAAFSLDGLLEWADRDQRQGAPDPGQPGGA
jgi:DNA ligase D